MTRIGFFYDGSFFHRVSSYYKHNHARRSFFNISGLQEYVRTYIAGIVGGRESMTQVTESHLYRGRFSVTAAKEKGLLETDRFFDQVLMYSGVQPHYLPMDERGERPHEVGVELLMVLDSIEMAFQKRIDVAVFFCGSSDLVPLMRKLHTQGIITVIIAVDLESESTDGRIFTTKTSGYLMDSANFTLMLNEDVEDCRTGIDNIFAQGVLTT